MANLLVLGGAAVSVLIAGTEDAWAIVAYLASAGLALLFVKPIARPSAVPLVLVPLFACLCLAAFLPQSYFPLPAWKATLLDMGSVPLAESVSPQPWLGWFWWWLLAGTCFVLVALLTAPLETKPLAVVVHSAAFFIAVYASLCIFALQSGWKYPFHGGAVFGFLPNRNHTATLLVAGSVLSFGLMQWRIARGDKLPAAFAALCGAPALAALLFFSTSRAGVVFLVVGLAVWAAGASRSPSIRARILSAVAVLAIFLAVLFAVGGSTVRDRLAELWRDSVSVRMEGEGEDVDFRQPVFRDTLRMIGDFPLSGAGLGQFRYVFPQYRKDSARAAVVLHPESDWLMVAAETGIPSALVLAGLFAWYVGVCWKSREGSGGMLRWTVASAVIAAALHGVVDVPWHRVSLGWFLLVLAASSVPSSARASRTPALTRFLFVLGGLVLAVAAGRIGYEKSQGRMPAPYRWPELSRDLQDLGEEGKYEEAETAAQRAVREFPLHHEAYYWLAGYLRAFEDTRAEIAAAISAGQAVEPVLAKVPAEQALILQPVDPDAAMGAWYVAIERAAAIDTREQSQELPSGGEQVRRALAMFGDDTPRQLSLARQLRNQPLLLVHWIAHANSDAVASYLRDEVPDVARFVDALPAAQRRQVLARWISSPDAARAVAFMEEREAMSADGEYWPLLARYYATRKDLPRAVRRIASSRGLPLDAPRETDAGLRGEMAALIAQGNTVAARRLANDAIAAKDFDPDDVAAAMSYFASQGDWESAWRAGSRLATESKLGQ